MGKKNFKENQALSLMADERKWLFKNSLTNFLQNTSLEVLLALWYVTWISQNFLTVPLVQEDRDKQIYKITKQVNSIYKCEEQSARLLHWRLPKCSIQAIQKYKTGHAVTYLYKNIQTKGACFMMIWWCQVSALAKGMKSLIKGLPIIVASKNTVTKRSFQ